MKTASTITRAVAMAGLVAAFGCSGGGGSSSSPAPSTTPAGPSTTPVASSTTVTIVGTTGNQAFSPNPIQGVAVGQSVQFTNKDSTVHHIVMDDGSAESGDIAPGATVSLVVKSSNLNYHCNIHPSMVGSINGTVAPTPDPGSGGGY